MSSVLGCELSEFVCVRCVTMTMLSAMSFLTSSAGEDMAETTAGGGKEGGESGTVAAGDESGLSESVTEAEVAGERMKRRTRATLVKAANVITSERVVSFIQQLFEMCVLQLMDGCM